MSFAGHLNPNWRGGSVNKTCAQCGTEFSVRPGYVTARFCSMQCVGKSQRGVSGRKSRRVAKVCVECGKQFLLYPAHAHRSLCCSMQCQGKWRSKHLAGRQNPNWNGGLSRLPYPWNFKEISKRIIERDGFRCKGKDCRGIDQRLTAHHIDYDKTNCAEASLITLCSSCNTRANFNRSYWQSVYTQGQERLEA